MPNQTLNARSLALALSLATTAGCHKGKSDPKTTPASQSSPAATATATTAAQPAEVKVPVTIAATTPKTAAKLYLAAAAPTKVEVRKVKLKSTAVDLAATADGMATIDATGKSGLKLTPGYYAVKSLNADGTEHRSGIIHVVKPAGTKLYLDGSAKNAQFFQLDDDTSVQLKLALKVVEADPVLFKASGLNMGNIAKQAQNLADGTKKKKTKVTDKDLAASAKVIASETKKNQGAVNTKADAKKPKLALSDDATDGGSVDAYGDLLASIDGKVSDPEIALKHATDNIDPRKLYRDAEAAAAKDTAVDADLLKEEQKFTGTDIALALNALPPDEQTDLGAVLLQEIALDELRDSFESSPAFASIPAADALKDEQAFEVALESKSGASLSAMFADLSDGSISAETTDPLLMVIAKADDNAAPEALATQMADVTSAFSADQQTELSAYVANAQAEKTAEDAAVAAAAEEIKAVEATADAAPDSAPPATETGTATSTDTASRTDTGTGTATATMTETSTSSGTSTTTATSTSVM